jgi:hypothetical protein
MACPNEKARVAGFFVGEEAAARYFSFVSL